MAAWLPLLHLSRMHNAVFRARQCSSSLPLPTLPAFAALSPRSFPMRNLAGLGPREWNNLRLSTVGTYWCWPVASGRWFVGTGARACGSSGSGPACSLLKATTAMSTNNQNPSTTQNPASGTSNDTTKTNQPNANTPNADKGNTPNSGKPETKQSDDRKDGKNNAPGSVPDPARTTSGTDRNTPNTGNDRNAPTSGSDSKTPQGSAE